VRRRGHDTGGRAHAPAYCSRESRCPGFLGTDRMRGFVRLHLLHEGARGRILAGQAIEVALEVLFDLPFGLDDEAQAERVTRPPGKQSEGEGARVPERIEKAWSSVEFAQALTGPSEVVRLFTGRLFELLPEGRIAGDEGLRAVEGLRADLAHVVDPHQGPGEAPGSVVERPWRADRRRRRPCRVICAGQRAQSGICGGNDSVDRTQWKPGC